MDEAQSGKEKEQSFPWELGIFDAHCHPTDTMSSIPTIAASMRARTLTAMATRSQDQELVAAIAEEQRVKGREAIDDQPQSNGLDSALLAGKIVPAFGWHPWFSHQLYDDSLSGEEATFDASSSYPETEKLRHYNAVLSPSPKSKGDEDFIIQLPTPQPLSAFITQTRQYLETHPLALVGEIGLDKAFRLPSHGPKQPGSGLTPGRREGEPLSPYRVNVDHQIRIFKAQLKLAGQLGRAVSVHGVQGHGIMYETLKSTWKGHEKRVVTKREKKRIAKGVSEDFSSSSSSDDDDDANDENEGESEGIGAAPAGTSKQSRSGSRPKSRPRPRPYPPRICLHSFTGGVPTLKQYVDDRACPAKIFFSFSMCVNFSTGGHDRDRRKHVAEEVMRACPDDRILMESDLHTAGQDMDEVLEEVYRKLCDVKGWGLREGVERVKKNYEEFICG